MKEVRPVTIRSVEGNAEAAKVLESAIKNGDDVVGLHFIGADIAILPTPSLEFRDCIFENCRFTGNTADKLFFVNLTV